MDAGSQEGWWYEGAGLYRHTWLVKRHPVNIATDGFYANPVRNAGGQWSIPVEVTFNSCDKAAANVEVESTLIGSSGKALVSGKARVTVELLKESVAKFKIAFASPELWSLEKPALSGSTGDGDAGLVVAAGVPPAVVRGILPPALFFVKNVRG